MVDEGADRNLVTHLTWVQARLPGGRVDWENELVVSDSGVASDTFNFVCRARMAGDPAPVIARVVAYFRSVRRPFSWWLGPLDRPLGLDRALLDAGFEAGESETAMAADLATLADGEPGPEDFRIVRVTTDRHIDDFARVIAANWDPPDSNVLAFYRSAGPILLQPGAPIRLYVGYVGELAVGTAELTVSDAEVGLYSIATLAAHRRKGYGSALTLHPLRDARRDGHRRAVLQASAAGRGVYARLGFRETGTYTEYQPPR